MSCVPRAFKGRLHSLAALCVLIAQLPLLGADEKHHGKNGHVLIEVKAGSYQLGAEGHPLNPRHSSRLNAFFISDAETTNAQFAAFVEATGYVTDAERRGSAKVFREGMADWVWLTIKGANWKHPMGPEGPAATNLPQHPVTQISGADAEAYCRWIDGRLPTLDEWETAARAGSKNLFPWGNKWLTDRANIWNGKTHKKEDPADGHVYTAPVRSYRPNRWGLYDVIGNVFEYCNGLPTPLKSREGALIAGRGGSWWCSKGTCHFFNLVDIGRMDRHGSLGNQGFRVVFDRLPR